MRELVGRAKEREKSLHAGIATGGFMANRLACEAPEMFAGVVSFAGSTWKDPSRCDPPAGAATNLLNIHGDADLTVPIDGGVNFVGVEFPSADAAVDTFADTFGCVPRAAAVRMVTRMKRRRRRGRRRSLRSSPPTIT